MNVLCFWLNWHGMTRLFTSCLQFSNLLGAVYRHGNLTFSKDGNSVISPVGNRVSVFDLKKYVMHI